MELVNGRSTSSNAIPENSFLPPDKLISAGSRLIYGLNSRDCAIPIERLMPTSSHRHARAIEEQLRVTQRAIVMILRTRASSAEVRVIDGFVGWPGHSWDLTGGYQDEFDRLRR